MAVQLEDVNPDLMKTSALIWFRPSQAFFDYFSQAPWKWTRYHDCGAGMGLLTKEMRKRKFDVRAYDMFLRNKPLVNDIARLNTGDEKNGIFAMSDVALLARPCHNENFIDATLELATLDGDAFYIGKAENMVRDLADYKFEPVAKDVGKDREVLVRVYGQCDKLHERRKIKNYLGAEEWWWYNVNTKRYTSHLGGLAGFYASDVGQGEKVLDSRYYGNDLQVTLPKSEVCDDESIMGWIAPDGEWFGCGYAQHDYVMQTVVGIQIRRAEELGFIRCHGIEGTHMLWSGGGKKPNPKQCSILKAKGYDPKF